MEISRTFNLNLWNATPTVRGTTESKVKPVMDIWNDCDAEEGLGQIDSEMRRIKWKLCEDLKPVVHIDAQLHSLSANPT